MSVKLRYVVYLDDNETDQKVLQQWIEDDEGKGKWVDVETEYVVNKIIKVSVK